MINIYIYIYIYKLVNIYIYIFDLKGIMYILVPENFASIGEWLCVLCLLSIYLVVATALETQRYKNMS